MFITSIQGRGDNGVLPPRRMGFPRSHQEGGKLSKCPPCLSALDTLILEMACLIPSGIGWKSKAKLGHSQIQRQSSEF